MSFPFSILRLSRKTGRGKGKRRNKKIPRADLRRGREVPSSSTPSVAREEREVGVIVYRLESIEGGKRNILSSFHLHSRTRGSTNRSLNFFEEKEGGKKIPISLLS